MRTIVLLTASNVFMTAAWYGHLRFRNVALWKVILVSWLIAFFGKTGKTLRLEVLAAAVVRWSVNGWHTARDAATRATGPGGMLRSWPRTSSSPGGQGHPPSTGLMRGDGKALTSP
jgi:hypothetical protein